MKGLLKTIACALIIFAVIAMCLTHVIDEWRGDITGMNGYYTFYTCNKEEFLEFYADVSNKTENVKIMTERCYGRNRYVIVFKDYMEN